VDGLLPKCDRRGCERSDGVCGQARAGELDGRRVARTYVEPFCLAVVYSSLGDKDHAFIWSPRRAQPICPCESDAPDEMVAVMAALGL
jgi:hypothetical protein